MVAAIAESVLVTWLKHAFPTARVVTETPHNLADVLPCIQVSRFGGADEYVSSFDNPSMDFDCYSASRIEARQLAYDVRSSLRDDLPGEVVDGASIVRVRTISGPTWTPYNNTNLRRFTYSAQIRLRSL
jgi:hypothetical protein